MAKYITPADGPILEIGSGYGYNVFALKELGYQVHAVDLPEVIKQSNVTINYQRRNIAFQPYTVGENETIPYPDEYFAGVLIIEVLEHLATNPLYLFSEVHRVLKSRGLALLTTPNQVHSEVG